MGQSKITLKKHTKSTNIMGALVIRENNLTMVTRPNCNIPVMNNYGYGIYYNDCRFLSGYVLKINGKRMTEILSSDQNNYESTIYLTNPDFYDREGNMVSKETLSIIRNVVIPGCVVETITMNNFNEFTVAIDLTLELAADFNDIFTVRGMTEVADGSLMPVSYDGKTLILSYQGRDGHRRSTKARFYPEPTTVNEGLCTFSLDLKPRFSQEIVISISVEDAPPEGGHDKPPSAGIDKMLERIESSYMKVADHTRNFLTDNSLFNRVLLRSMLDLRMMHMSKDGDTFYSAGVPWYDTLFGRDSIISAIQVLPYHTDVVKGTLRLLARYQGKAWDDWQDEQPGRILHELRVGEKANLNMIPQTPYYGSVDATPLFLILMADYVDWTGDIGLFNELIPNVDAALAWIDNSDLAGNGFLSYAARSKSGLYNQGWKDSWDAVMHSDGSLARSPIALAEVQGYVYMAKMRIADLYEKIDRKDDANRLRSEAADLKKRFNESFWIDEKGFFAMAIDPGGKCDVISSNPAQCLWSGIVDKKYARQVADRMFEPDMFTGWGIRTLSTKEVRYNPLGYHIGTVWPHDNSIIACGLYKYGYNDRFSELFTAMYEAASAYTLFRLPELFGGFDRGKHNVPIKYPVACSPQAWSSGTIPHMLMASLGFRPDALNHRLTLVDPYLPSWLNLVNIINLRVGDSFIDLIFQRRITGTLVDVVKKSGDIKVLVEY
ncbi:amylo-alpha-1,6-glucosidase [Methanocella sp. CWC-04]|uniref:Amylo-alpha-1,6-glucosidase n=1 Tax=Methanooceanicella nereidis TaxID=2052831 RepID=A0AAP2W6K6_9EURY|nr:amylo-alpha-1,6-glucosidase [Methanocella sp. CWC-04]MCD1294374.1 amylo-alpha-1,6-glucosidase [Methanocella sp. CWC-04]